MEIIIGIGIILIGFVVYKGIKINNNWKSWPTLEEYWQLYPHCKTNYGTRCHKCNSNYIRHYGWTEKSDRRRIHKCNQCGTYLYRRYD
jgi:hypothetical protein